MCFGIKSQFSYVAKPETSRAINVLTLRKRYWQETSKHWHKDAKHRAILQNFKNLNLIRYIDQVYLPIKKARDKIIKNET